MGRRTPKHWVPDECRQQWDVEKDGDKVGVAIYLDEDGEQCDPDDCQYRRVFMEVPGMDKIYNAIIQITDDKDLISSLIRTNVDEFLLFDKNFYKKFTNSLALELNKTALGHYGPLLPQLRYYDNNRIVEYKEPGPDDIELYDDDEDEDDEKLEVSIHDLKRSYSINQTRDD